MLPMFSDKSSHKPAHRVSVRLLSALLVSGVLVTGLAVKTLAQGLPGLTIFSGVDRKFELGYRLDQFGRLGMYDRYHLRIPANKMSVSASEFAINYPATYRGTFDPKRIEVRANGHSVALDEVNWDRENRVIEIYPKEPIAANTRVEIVLSNVRNPNDVGTHYFNASVRSPGDVPLLRYLGTWIIQIGDSNY